MVSSLSDCISSNPFVGSIGFDSRAVVQDLTPWVSVSVGDGLLYEVCHHADIILLADQL